MYSNIFGQPVIGFKPLLLQTCQVFRETQNITPKIRVLS